MSVRRWVGAGAAVGLLGAAALVFRAVFEWSGWADDMLGRSTVEHAGASWH